MTRLRTGKRQFKQGLTVTTGSAVAAAVLGLIAVSLPTQPVQAQVGLRVNPAPVTAPINRSLNVLNRQVSRSVNQLGNQVNRSVNQINRSVNRGLNTVNRYSYGPQVRYPSSTTYPRSNVANRAVTPRSSYYAPQSLQSVTPQTGTVELNQEQLTALREAQQKAATSQAAMGILPAGVLAQLTPRQIGLQNAAQKVALTAEIGEIIEWTDGDRYGAVQVMSEHKFGTMLCREFKQTLSFKDETETATGNACARGSGQWARANY